MIDDQCRCIARMIRTECDANTAFSHLNVNIYAAILKYDEKKNQQPNLKSVMIASNRIQSYSILHFQQTALHFGEFKRLRNRFVIFHSHLQRFTIGFHPKWWTFFRINGQPMITGTFTVLYLNCKWCCVHQHIKRCECDLFCQRIVGQSVVNSDLYISTKEWLIYDFHEKSESVVNYLIFVTICFAFNHTGWAGRIQWEFITPSAIFDAQRCTFPTEKYFLTIRE